MPTSGTITLPATSTPTPTATSTPSQPTISIGNAEYDDVAQILTLPIQLWNIPAGARLGALSIEVAFDPALLMLVDCQADPEQRFDMALCRPSQSSGRVQLSLLSGQGRTDNLDAAVLRFGAVGLSRGNPQLTIVSHQLADIDGNPCLLYTSDAADE